MNPAIKRFAEYTWQLGLQPYAVYDGLRGLVGGQIRPLKPEDISGIIYRGGTVIRSSRCPEFHQPEARAQAAEHLKQNGIAGLVVLGGNGSFQAVHALEKEHGNIAAAGIPATIDNDVPGSDYALGVDTALNVIRHAIDEIRDTAASFKRAFVVEVMGRGCGYLALVSAITSGAEICLIPEVEFNREAAMSRLRKEMGHGRSYALAIVCEGVKGGSERIATMFREDLGLTCRVTALGHIQRGGSPTVEDRLRAFECVTLAVDGLLAGESRFAVLRQHGSFARREPVQQPATLPADLLALGKRFFA